MILLIVISLPDIKVIQAAETSNGNASATSKDLHDSSKLTKVTTFEISNTTQAATVLDISPDSKTIIFASNSGDAAKKSSLWAITLSNSSSNESAYGNPRLIELSLTTSFSNMFNPRISPDGSEILFVATYASSISDETKQGLFEYNLEKNTLAEVSLNIPTVRSADWVPNGTILYSGGNASSNSDTIWISSKNGTNSKQVYNSPEPVGDIDVSSDGTKVAFITSSQENVYASFLKVLDIKTGKTRILGNSTNNNENLPAAYHDPRWSPNNEFIVTTYSPKTLPASEIRLISIDGTINTPVYSNSSFNAVGAAITGGDGKSVIFGLAANNKDLQGESGIYMLQIDSAMPDFATGAALMAVVVMLGTSIFLGKAFITKYTGKQV
ncbi:LpqB family beta-propeller domain-containing protein [Candidatus Nitrososphaera evergladensis]|nr:LpqB family beta-propeller domain-containing protein [Candidatus Nitrososphaera evergladensis]